ncbi:MAG: hypothetical protein A4S09_06050 [Proteobacteria bacterium SG_bin7]|nr:MAG: hypothetical protein A4S09_06050 [Proteobacteria bacterium SG_bin7]
MLKIILSALMAIGNFQPSFADNGANVAYSTNQFPYSLRVERMTDANNNYNYTDTFRIMDCGLRAKSYSNNQRNCTVILSDIQGVEKTNVPSKLEDLLREFNNSTPVKERRHNHSVYGPIVIGLTGLCLISGLMCIWIPMAATEGLLIPLSLLIFDSLLGFGIYKLASSANQLARTEREFKKLSSTIIDLSKSKKIEAEIPVSEDFMNTFKELVSTHLSGIHILQ